MSRFVLLADLPHRNGRFLPSLVVVALLLVSCGQQSGPEVHPLSCPAPPGSAEPHLVTGDAGIALSWLVHRDDGSHSLQFAVLSSSGWSPVHTIHEGDQFFANWADRPSVLPLADGTWVAHWLEKSGPDTYAYDVHLAHSADGEEWSEALTPHDDGTRTEHGFVSLLADGNDGVLAVWLDGRETAGKPHEEAEMTLRAARWSPAGLTDQALLDARTCDCCPTTAVVTDRGVLVAYRDRGDDETRDISLVRLENGNWTAPRPLHEDGWIIQGCPVNGPVLAARDNLVAAAWYTEAGGQRVNVALSENSGDSFGPAFRVDDGHPAGRADVVLLDDGDAFVVWLESPAAGDAEIRGRRVRRNGRVDPSFAITTTDGSRGSGYPQLVYRDGTATVAWTRVDEPTSIRMATITGLD